jgi:hypothetical protein
MRQELRYDDGLGDYSNTRPTLDPGQIKRVTTQQNQSLTGEVPYGELTADADDFILGDGVYHRFTTDASRTVTGFANVGSGIKVVYNAGSNDLVLADLDASSQSQNQIITPSGSNLTLEPNESAQIVYDSIDLKVRVIATTGS